VEESNSHVKQQKGYASVTVLPEFLDIKCCFTQLILGNISVLKSMPLLVASLFIVLPGFGMLPLTLLILSNKKSWLCHGSGG
jgi:hypothetical protein